MYAEVAMSDKHTLGPWVRRFLMEHLPDDRNLSRNTQQSYRDALRLMIVFAANRLHKKADKLLVADIDADIVRVFLRHLEEERDCTISTRNQRLAAIHALATFIGQRSPEHLGWSAQLRSVEFKRSTLSAIWTNVRSICCLLFLTNPHGSGTETMSCCCSSTTPALVRMKPRNWR
jgi:integrase/recombinase XerD